MLFELLSAIRSGEPEQVRELLIVFLMWLPIIMLSLSFHEASHAFIAYKLGDPTARNFGRVTLNPVKHLDPIGFISMLIVGFGWANPVPVNPNNFKNPKNGMALTAIAGPVSNLIMSFIAMIIYRVLFFVGLANGSYPTVAMNVFALVVTLNLSLAIFNLLPIPPLDGSRIFNLFMSEKTYFKVMKYEKYVFVGLAVLLYSGLLDKPLSWLQDIGLDVMWFLTGWVDHLMKLILF